MIPFKKALGLSDKPSMRNVFYSPVFSWIILGFSLIFTSTVYKTSYNSISGERNFYMSIAYFEPFDWRNQRAFGYGMWSNETRRRSMMIFRDEGVAVISGIITLV